MAALYGSALIVGPPGRWRSSVGVLLQAAPEITPVYQADDYPTALHAMAETHPTLVLLDCGLPGEEVWQTLAHIRRTWPQTRCLMLVHDSTQAQRAAQSGSDAVLHVGFSGEALYSTIHELLARASQSA